MRSERGHEKNRRIEKRGHGKEKEKETKREEKNKEYQERRKRIKGLDSKKIAGHCTC